MATGSGIQQGRGIVTTNITPTIGVPNVADDIERAAKSLSTFGAIADQAFAKRAAMRGARAGIDSAQAQAGDDAASTGTAAPPVPDRPLLYRGDYDRAFNASYLATIKNDIDRRETELRAENRFDPRGYEAASRKAISGFIQGAPEKLAIDVEQYANRLFSQGQGVIATMAAERAEKEAMGALNARTAKAADRLVALAGQPGGMDTPQFAAWEDEYRQLQREKVENPVFTYSQEEADRDLDEVLDRAGVANITRLAVEAYGEAGKGLPGQAASRRFLENEVLNGEAFKSLPPERRAKLYNQAVGQLDDFWKADMEAARAEREREREEAADRREAVGEWRLRIMTGDTNEASIRAATDIDEGQKASLIAAARAQARRERAEARSAAALERAGRAASYREFSDAAAAGTLSAGEIADARGAGLLTAGQARTLAAKRDKAIKPVIDDVMAPVRDAAKRPGMSIRGAAVPTARAEEEAAAWARLNPDAPLEERLKVGGLIAQKYMGGKTSTPGPAAGPASANRNKTDQLRALQARKASMTDAAYRAERKRILDGAP